MKRVILLSIIIIFSSTILNVNASDYPLNQYSMLQQDLISTKADLDRCIKEGCADAAAYRQAYDAAASAFSFFINTYGLPPSDNTGGGSIEGGGEDVTNDTTIGLEPLSMTVLSGPSGVIDPYHDNYNQETGEQWGNGDRAKHYTLSFTLNQEALVSYMIFDNSGFFLDTTPILAKDPEFFGEGTHTIDVDLSTLDGRDIHWKKEDAPYLLRVIAEGFGGVASVTNDDTKFDIMREPYHILLDAKPSIYAIKVPNDMITKDEKDWEATKKWLISWIPVLGEVQDGVEWVNAVWVDGKIPGQGKDDIVIYFKWRVNPYSWNPETKTYDNKWINPKTDSPDGYNEIYNGPREIHGPIEIRACSIYRQSIKRVIVGTRVGSVIETKKITWDRFWVPQTLGEMEKTRMNSQFYSSFNVDDFKESPLFASYVRKYPASYTYPTNMILGGVQRSWGPKSTIPALKQSITNGVSVLSFEGASNTPSKPRIITVSTSNTVSNTQNIPISSADKQVSFQINWVEATTPLTLTLLDPNGAPVTASGSVEIVEHEKLIDYRVSNPAPGLWTMRVTGPMDTIYQYGAYIVESELQAIAMPPQVADPTDTVSVSIDLNQNGVPIPSATVVAKLVDDAGGQVSVTLNDDGYNGDTTAGDGEYTSIVNEVYDSAYQVEISVEGTVNGQPFTRVEHTEITAYLAPQVEITSIIDDSTVSGVIPVQVSAIHATNITDVSIFFDDYLVAKGTYVDLDLSDVSGVHTITATATNELGYTAQDAVIINVDSSAMGSEITLLSHDFCLDIDGNGAPLGAATSFSKDSIVYSLLNFEKITIGDSVRWEFASPSGETVIQEITLEYEGEAYAYGVIELPGYSNVEGIWGLTVYVNDVEAYSNFFEVIEETQDSGIPGYTFLSVIVGAIISVIILKNRRQSPFFSSNNISV